MCRTIEITQDGGFFFGQPPLATLRVEQEFRARAKGVGPDGKDGVLACFMLAQLRANARKQDSEAERLADVIVGSGFEPENGVRVGVTSGQHDERRTEA